jgi:small subunit ribosomal protein S17
MVRKQLVGRVASNKMDKTVVVVVEQIRRHPLYGKVVKVRKNFYAHDEGNVCQVGDMVRITECRPMSRLKRWVVEGVVHQSETPEEAVA